jgi:hypothetical protein
MNRASIALLILSLFPHLLFPQTERPSVVAGMETAGAGVHYASRTGITPNIDWALRVNPYLMARLGKNFFAGIGALRETANIRGVQFTPLHGIGLHGRYYFPFQTKNAWITDRFRFYGESSWYLLDHRINAQTGALENLGSLDNQQFQLGVSANFRLFRSLYFDLTYQSLLFTQGKPFLFTPAVALEYHFAEKRPPYQARVLSTETSKTPYRIFDSSGFLQKVTMGASYTFIFDDLNTDDLFRYQEHTLNLNAAVSLGTHLDLGVAYLAISVREKGAPSERFSLAGAFMQYDFLRDSPGMRLFAETGFYRGNFCTCGNDAPYYRPNLSYIPYGGGMEFKLFKKRPWYLDMSFLWYQLVSRVPGTNTWAYSQYVAGLNYRFSP